MSLKIGLYFVIDTENRKRASDVIGLYFVIDTENRKRASDVIAKATVIKALSLKPENFNCELAH
jgi:hypothetical protein